jgi:hypothetical protein
LVIVATLNALAQVRGITALDEQDGSQSKDEQKSNQVPHRRTLRSSCVDASCMPTEPEDLQRNPTLRRAVLAF